MPHATYQVSIRAGHLDGSAFWDPSLQSYGVDLSVFDERRCYPPPRVRHGTRHAEFVTVDALANSLAAVGLGLDGGSLQAVQELGHRLDVLCGPSEIIGLMGQDEKGRLYLRTPSRAVIELRPPLDHPHYRFTWGQGHEAAAETGRAIVERSYGPCSPEDLHAFVLTLAVEFLQTTTGDFSFSTSSLCDWYLADSPLVTTCDAAERHLLRRRLDAAAVTAGAGSSPAD